jgi:hypothetical protein
MLIVIAGPDPAIHAAFGSAWIRGSSPRVTREKRQLASDRGWEIYLIPDFLIPDSCSVLRRPGGHCEEPIPDPIPNSAVKVLCADGTKSQGLEE